MAINKNDGLTEGEVNKVLDKLGDKATPEQINEKLHLVAEGGFLGPAARMKAASDMSKILGKEVTSNDAKETAQAAINFTNKDCNGNTENAIAFIQDINGKCQPIQSANMKELVDSGAAGELKKLYDHDKQQYHAVLNKINTQPELLAKLQKNPNQAIADLTNATPAQQQNEQVLTQNEQTPEAPETNNTEPTTHPPGANEHTNPALLAALTGTLSKVWHSVAGDALPQITMERGDVLIAEIIDHIFEKGSEVIGNAPEMIEKVAENMGIECSATRIDPDTGSEITVAQNTHEQPEATNPSMEMNV
jgi:hypothetical protein